MKRIAIALAVLSQEDRPPDLQEMPLPVLSWAKGAHGTNLVEVSGAPGIGGLLTIMEDMRIIWQTFNWR